MKSAYRLRRGGKPYEGKNKEYGAIEI